MRYALRTFILALPFVLAAVAVSCTKQEDTNPTPQEEHQEEIQEELTYLRINSVSTSELVKSPIEGTSFPTDEEVSIGLFLEGEGYTDTYKNVKFTRAAGGTKWEADREITLTDKVATVYAYYPYNEGVTKIKEVRVISSFDGDDFMWATPVEGVNKAKDEVSLTFHHALALIEITFNLYGFDPYRDKLTYLNLSGTDDGFTVWSTLNATNGSLSSGDVEALSTYNEFSFSNGRIVVPCLLVPKSAGDDAKNKQKFILTCEFAGKQRTATLDGKNGVIIRQNTKSKISLTIKNGDSKMEVQSVSVGSWTDPNVSGNTATVDGHTVTFNCPEGLKYEMDVAIQAGTVLGESTGDNQKASVIFRYDKNSIPDNKFAFNNTTPGCTLTLDEQKGIVTVTDISDDVTVDIFGTYIRYIATSRMVPYNKSAFGATYDESKSTYSNGSGVVAIDGTVTSIGKQAFMNLGMLGISLPEELETIGENAFDNCEYLTNINLQECDKLKTIGNDAFYGIGTKAESGAFSLVLPEGLEEIGATAFGSANISSVTLPSTLKKIDDNGFYNCVALKTITSKATNPPALGDFVFYYFSPSYNREPMENIETIYVPAGSVDSYKAAEGWSAFSSKITGM